MLDAFESYTSEPALYATKIRLLGNGAAAPTEVLGGNVAVSYIGVGQYRLTFADNPGVWCGPNGRPGLQAVTPGDVKAIEVIVGAYTAPTSSARGYVDLFVYDSGTLHDLAANEWITVDLDFKRTGV